MASSLKARFLKLNDTWEIKWGVSQQHTPRLHQPRVFQGHVDIQTYVSVTGAPLEGLETFLRVLHTATLSELFLLAPKVCPRGPRGQTPLCFCPVPSPLVV